MPTSLAVTSFVVNDMTSGSSWFTDETTVAVTFTGFAPAGTSVAGYQITQTPDQPTDWLGAAPLTYTFTSGTAEGYVTLYPWVKDDTEAVAGGTAATILYITAPEVPKSQMTASASTGTAAQGLPSLAIDGSLAGTGWHVAGFPAPQWLQLDLGKTYDVTAFLYRGRDDNATSRIKKYNIYLAADPAYRGDVDCTGTFPLDSFTVPPVAAVFPAPAQGRYLILEGWSWGGDIGAVEVWVYGTEVSLTQVDQFTTSTAPMSTGSVAITLTASAAGTATIDGLMVTQDSTPPPVGDTGWMDEITEYTIAAGTENGLVTLYGWAKDSAGVVAGKWFTLFYMGLPEIPKSGMTATASNFNEGAPKGAIDGSVAGQGWHASATFPAPQWLQLDLGKTYDVTAFLYRGRDDNANGRIGNYNIYVTADPANRGEAVCTGTFPWDSVTTPAPAFFPAPAQGRYLILEGWAWQSGGTDIGAVEVWVYGTEVSLTQVDQFTTTTAPMSTGSVAITLTASAGGTAEITGFMVTQDSTLPPVGDARWTDSVTEYTIAAGTESGFITLYGWAKDSAGVVAVKTLTVLYVGLPEIPKSQMTATASNAAQGAPGAAIDGSLADIGWHTAGFDAPPQWLQLDLGKTCQVTALLYRGRDANSNGRIKNYNIYVTDDPANWGAAACTGAFPFDSVTTPAQAFFPAPAQGRYLILEGWPWVADIGAVEVWVYGTALPTGPAITAFTMADQSTASAAFTSSATVNVSIAATASEGRVISAWAITQSPDPPADGWLGADPTDYAITGTEGTVALYAWVKDDAGSIGGPATASILFSTATPIPSGATVTDNLNGTATVAWTTDIPAEGGANYGPVKLNGSTPSSTPLEGVVGTAHSVTINVAVGTNYKIVLVNNEKLSSDLLPVPGLVIYWPSIWPIPCDVNRDCKVNILDLISIRNKLNQPVATADNIYADVNLPAPDNKINILDLIAVRNKLNTQCPQ